MRFSLKWLFGVVFYVAAGCALVASTSDLFLDLFNAAFAALCLLSLLGAIFSRSERRAFWGGCAIVAWLFTLSDVLPDGHNGLPALVHAPKAAVSETLFDLSYYFDDDPLGNLRSTGGEAFVGIGASVVGGVLARWFRSRSAQAAETRHPAPAGS